MEMLSALGLDVSALTDPATAVAAAQAAIAAAAGNAPHLNGAPQSDMAAGGGGASSSADAGGNGSDPKATLVELLVGYLKRPMMPTDIIYQVMQFGDQCQATVTLVCVGGDTYAGEPASNSRDAELNAAKVAFVAWSEEIAKVQAAQAEAAKRKSVEPPLDASGRPEVVVGPLRHSWVLQQMLMRLLRRPIRPDDVAVQTIQTALGWQSTLAVPGLPEPWQKMAWAGEVATSPKEAEEHASRHAVNAIRQDPLLSQGLGNLAVPPIGGGFVEPACWQLETTLMQILRRILRNEDLSVNTKQMKTGWQTVIVVPPLPDHCTGKAWAGEVSACGADAEEYSARKAIETIRSDPVLLPKLMFNYIKDPDQPEPSPAAWGKGHSRALGNVQPASANAGAGGVIPPGGNSLPNLKGKYDKGGGKGKFGAKGVAQVFGKKGGWAAPAKGKGKKGKEMGVTPPNSVIDFTYSDWTPPPTAADWQDGPGDGNGGGDWGW